MPFGQTIGKGMSRAIVKEWRRNSSMALGVAEHASGLSREQFAEWASTDARAVPLYLKVLWAAGMNGHDKTLRAMGTVLGNAARATAENDEVGFEDCELALRAMAEMTPRHFAVLARIAQGHLHHSEDGTPNYRELIPAHVAAHEGISESAAHQCLLNLAGAGLVVSKPVLEATAYPITTLGMAVVSAAGTLS